MLTRLFTIPFALACALSVSAFGEPVLIDHFNLPDTADFNSHLNQRQSGSAASTAYRMVTMVAPGGNAADRFKIQNQALSLTSAGSNKGPASLGLDRKLENLGPRYHIAVTARPINNWAAVQWTPFQRGGWPDTSAGLSMIIQANGVWTAWNNTQQPKQILGRGKVTASEKYRITWSIDETDGKKVTLSINGIPVIDRKPFSDEASAHYLLLQSNGQAEFDDLVIGPEETTAAESTWVEAEDFTATNIPNGICVNSGSDGASASMLLRLEIKPYAKFVAKPPYFADYKLRVAKSGNYNLWIAATTQTGDSASPLSYSIDGAAPVPLRGTASVGGGYGKPPYNGLGWVAAGMQTLEAKEHTLRLLIDQPRAKDGRYMVCIDAILLTSDLAAVPTGNHPEGSTQPAWAELMQKMTPKEYQKKLDRSFYEKVIAFTYEEVGSRSAEEVLRKIKARPLPSPGSRTPELTEFGLHGMERPFVVVARSEEQPQYQAAYELLARAGVDSFRTAESCWHRLAQGAEPGKLNFADLDYQLASAQKYGQTHLLTVGYPPASYTVGNHIVSAVKPEFRPQYEGYLGELIRRCKGQGVRYVELGNEVDAPDTWWRKSTPKMYFEEMCILRKVVDETAPEMKTVAFGATYSRDNEKGGPQGGRRFVEQCLELGIDQYTDAYSIHHTSHLASKDFPAFMRRELAKVNSHKPLLDSEQWGEGPYPYDNIKAFARCFFLYDMKRVDFFIAKDFCENGYTKAWGLFDLDWHPKLRLLAYAFSVDAMKGRKLVGIAQPAENIEAYVLEETRPDVAKEKRYSIVVWNHRREVENLEARAEIAPTRIRGLKGVTAASDWRLNAISYDSRKPSFQVADAPIAIYASELPDWKLQTRAEFLDSVAAGNTEAP